MAQQVADKTSGAPAGERAAQSAVRAGPEALSLPPCPYRGLRQDGLFSCAAAEGGSVSAQDCLSCPIPEALSHPQACLYLVPLRHESVGRFVCRWSFTWAREPAPRNWRSLCFCCYWFPRPPREDMIYDLAAHRARYLRVLRGEEALRPRRAPELPRAPRKAKLRLRDRLPAWLKRFSP